MKQLKLFILVILTFPVLSQAQLGEAKNKFTKADTLRGSLNENRDWWDVKNYKIKVKPDFETKTLKGSTSIFFHVPIDKKNAVMQIDLQDSLEIDSIFLGVSTLLRFTKSTNNVWYVYFDNAFKDNIFPSGSASIFIYYHGKPKEALRPPWDGGWIWRKDAKGRPWMSAAVQGLGASAWFPCKDHQSDEPDNGASLTMNVPDSLVAVGNGRLKSQLPIPNSNLRSYTWEVKNPINNYNIIPYIGKYENFTDTLMGENGQLDLSYWVLDYNLEKAKEQFKQVKPMLRAFEHWFGPYPFYEDSYKLVDAPHLGMEHQSAVAYGNNYQNGYRGADRSRTGWGSKWDFIIIHESGHEWFANNITSKDIADMWIHEGFTNYSETLFTEYYYGKTAGNEYNYGIRRNISNDVPIIGQYGVNKEGSGDMYDKGGNLLHLIRHVINDDEKFRDILRGLNKTFWHQTVTTGQVEDYIIQQSGIPFQKTFDQYLRSTQIPKLEFYFNKKKTKVCYRWANCIAGFDLPLVINNKRIPITTKWQSAKLSNADISGWNPVSIEKLYYITAVLVQDMQQ